MYNAKKVSAFFASVHELNALNIHDTHRLLFLAHVNNPLNPLFLLELNLG